MTDLPAPHLDPFVTAVHEKASGSQPGSVWPDGFKLTVIVPVFNEQRTLGEVVRMILAVDVPLEIIIVDDGSTDGTRALLQSEIAAWAPNIRVALHEQNRGKGAAIRTAIPLASGTVCIIQDADLELDPQEYPLLLAPMVRGHADVVYGSRFLLGGAHRVQSFQHYMGNRALTMLSNLMTDLYLTDMETCYKAVRTELLQSLELNSEGFDIEPELTAKLARARARFYEVPVTYHPRGYTEGKKIGWRDGFQAIWAILRYRFGG